MPTEHVKEKMTTMKKIIKNKKHSKFKIMDMNDLYAFYNGAIHLAVRCEVTAERWQKTGIPEKYYERIARDTNLKITDVYLISRTADKYNAK